MAQLRDSQTSALLYEGTPAQVAALAAEVGASDVLFDDVGLDFDADAILEGAEARVAYLRELGADDEADEAQAQLDEARAFDISGAIEQARSG